MFFVLSCSCLCAIRWTQVSSREWRCSCKNFHQNHKHVFTLSIIPPYWYDTDIWNPFSWKTRTCPLYIINIMSADGLAMQGQYNGCWCPRSLQSQAITRQEEKHLIFGISYTGKRASLYWFGALASVSIQRPSFQVHSQSKDKATKTQFIQITQVYLCNGKSLVHF